LGRAKGPVQVLTVEIKLTPYPKGLSQQAALAPQGRPRPQTNSFASQFDRFEAQILKNHPTGPQSGRLQLPFEQPGGGSLQLDLEAVDLLTLLP
jgi:hypothetical protein